MSKWTTDFSPVRLRHHYRSKFKLCDERAAFLRCESCTYSKGARRLKPKSNKFLCTIALVVLESLFVSLFQFIRRSNHVVHASHERQQQRVENVCDFMSACGEMPARSVLYCVGMSDNKSTTWNLLILANRILITFFCFVLFWLTFCDFLEQVTVSYTHRRCRRKF